MLRIERIRKLYGAVAAVDDVSVTIGHGELCTLLGPSGCGKTTLLRMIAGLEQQTSGKIFFHDTDVSNTPPFARQIGMVFQSYALFPHLTVDQNIAYGLQVLKQPRATIRQAVSDVTALLGLDNLGHRHVNQLSGGQQQRVALARALVMKPQILLFDEPLSNLDAKLRRGIREEIRSIQQQFGITAIYVTHDQSEALAISDRVLLMHRGKIVQHGSPRELYESPADDFVANFIGEANFFMVQVKPVNGRIQIRFANYEWEQDGQIPAAGTYQLLLRPDRIRLSTHATAVRAVIKKSTYVGASMEYTLDSPVGELFVIDPLMDEALFQVGQEVGFDPQSARPTIVGTRRTSTEKSQYRAA